MDGYIRTHLKVQYNQLMLDAMTTDTDTTVTSGTSNNQTLTFKEQNNYIKMPPYVTTVVKYLILYLRMLQTYLMLGISGD